MIGERKLRTPGYRRVYFDYGIYNKPKSQVKFHRYRFNWPLSIMGAHAYWITKYEPKEKRYLFVSYEDPLAIKDIAHYIKRKHYLGLSDWQLLGDLNYRSPHSLLRTMIEK